ncbi:G-protein coupled receptor GRL101-like protein [Trichoplax sp. H2]|nr:G-protein coupled receptor GRL101-like protein [Trichoplax sp. H2]|eukprot:RDD36304.1 G-protein coupled receptor GRL101-like protein [Trichoplax sp. H2]
MNSEILSSCQRLLAHFSLQAFIWIVGSLALIGNIVVLLQNYATNQGKKKSVPICLINNLAISDLLMGLYLLIIAIADIMYSTITYGTDSESWLSHPVCYIACGLVAMSSLTSVLIMIVISVDRYICIVYPFSTRKLTLQKAMTVMGFMWSLGIAFSAVPTIFSIDQPGYLRLYTYNSMCMPNNYQNLYYMIWMISYLLITVIAWIIMIVLYACIFIAVRKSSKGIRKSSTNDNKVLAIRLSLILLSDLICWLPYYYINLSGFIQTGRVDLIALQFIGILTLPINSAVNPFLYTITNIEVLQKTFSRRSRRSTTGSRSTSVKLSQINRSDVTNSSTK